MFVKICGIRDMPALQAAMEEGADAVGFVFHAKSPRYVTPAQAIPLSAIFGRARVKVGVFVDEPPLEVAGIADAARLDYVQVHPGRDRSAVRRVRSALTMGGRAVGVILGVALGSPDDVPEAAAFIREAQPEMALVEGRPVKGSLPGGNGRAWDWALLRKLDDALGGKVPLLLAGGLTPENVAEAIDQAAPHGVDASSGVERGGRKDPELIRGFIRAAKGAAASGEARGTAAKGAVSRGAANGALPDGGPSGRADSADPGKGARSGDGRA